MNKVDDYIEGLDDHRRGIAAQVRELLLEYVPDIEEKFSFKIPFYHYYGMFCYLNPIKNNGMALGFCRGKDLTLSFPQLEQEGRKIIAIVKLYSRKDIITKQVRELILAAAEWNKEAKLNGIRMVAPVKKKSKKQR